MNTALLSESWRWLSGDWHELLSPPGAAVALSLSAVACGSLIGIERDRKGKAVGFRTLTLVSLGAATFTQLSSVLGGHDGLSARVIAGQIVSGVGFLGAGAIMRGNGAASITGLTSAATIWVMAAVGMTAGAGYGGAALVMSGLILAVLTVISALERHYIGPCRFTTARVGYRAERGKARVRIENLLDESRILPVNRQWEGEDDAPAVTVRYCYAHLQHKEFLARLATMPEVEEVIPADPSRLTANTESIKAGASMGARRGG